MTEVPCKLYALHASNGDALLLFGEDEAGHVFLWPTCHIARHAFAFARWSKARVEHWRGKRLQLQHPMDARVRRWAAWLGVQIHGDEAVI